MRCPVRPMLHWSVLLRAIRHWKRCCLEGRRARGRCQAAGAPAVGSARRRQGSLVSDPAFDRHRVRVRPASRALRWRGCPTGWGVRRCTPATSGPTRGRPGTPPRGRRVVRAGPLYAPPGHRRTLSRLALVVTAHHCIGHPRRYHCSLSVLGTRPIMYNPVESRWPTAGAGLSHAKVDPGSRRIPRVNSRRARFCRPPKATCCGWSGPRRARPSPHGRFLRTGRP